MTIDTVKMNRSKNELNYLRSDIKEVYRQLMKHLAIKYRSIDSDEIRLEILRTITDHVMTRTKERLRRKVRSKTVKVPVLIDPTKSIEAKEHSFLP